MLLPKFLVNNRPGIIVPSVPSDPYINNVVLLMHMDNNATDEFGHTATVTGVTYSDTVKKFGTHGALLGWGNYLTFPSSADFGFDSGDFTLEAWIYGTQTAWSNYGNNCILDTRISSTDTWASAVCFFIPSNDRLALLGSNGVVYTGNTTVPSQQWVHVAATRQGGTIRLFVNGTMTEISSTLWGAGTTRPLNVGRGWHQNTGDIMYLNGYIDELRITKGVARYTANFTPPIAPFPNPTDPYFSSVTLLMHMEGANNGTTFTDEKSATISNTSVTTSSTYSKFGTSAFFGSTTSSAEALTITSSKTPYTFTDDFTIEFYIYPLVVSGASYGTGVIDARDPGLTASSGWIVAFGYSGHANKYAFSYNNILINSDNAAVANTWTHYAITRSGTTVRMFIDGIQQAQTVSISGTIPAAQFNIGAYSSGYYDSGIAGYLDELRITKGVARYTSNFTPPTAPFPNQ